MRIFRAGLLILFAHCSESFACNSEVAMYAEGSDGVQFELRLDSLAVQNAPQWSPSQGEPPLSISRATDIAISWAKEKYSKVDEVRVREIALTNLGCAKNADRWYYVFDFVLVLGGKQMFGPGNWAAVLMDGTVVEGAQVGSVSPEG